MKFPSIRYIREHAEQTLRRFPYVLISAFLSAVFAVLQNENDFKDPFFTHLLMTCAMGIPLFFALGLYCEKPLKVFRPPQAALLSGGVLFLLLFHFTSGAELDKSFFLHYAQWSLMLHLAAAFTPYLNRGEVNGFWQFNRLLFLRFILSVIYSAVFYLGLALALGSLDFLLGISLHNELFGDLWFVAVFMVLTWHFLAGVPKDLKGLNTRQDYPGALKIFTQYMLIPLVCLYLFILYVYMAKIVFLRDWPKGIVTWLVSGLSVFGVFTLLLVYPVETRKENRWLKTYARLFYWALFPLLALLMVTAGKRVEQYSFTEERYFVLVLAFWIFGVAVYFLRSPARNIKWIPLSLCLLALFTSFGPWGAYEVSKRAQLSRLKGYLVKDGLWNGQKAQKTDKPVSFADEKDITSILIYLIENHGIDSVKGWFDLGGQAGSGSLSDSRFDSDVWTAKIMQSLGLHQVSAWEKEDSQNFYWTAESGNDPLVVTGYDYLYQVIALTAAAVTFTLENKPCLITFQGGIVVLKQGGVTLLSFETDPAVQQLQARGEIKPQYESPLLPSTPPKIPKPISLSAKGRHWSGQLCLNHLTLKLKNGHYDIKNGSGTLLLKKNR